LKSLDTEFKESSMWKKKKDFGESMSPRWEKYGWEKQSGEKRETEKGLAKR